MRSSTFVTIFIYLFSLFSHAVYADEVTGISCKAKTCENTEQQKILKQACEIKVAKCHLNLKSNPNAELLEKHLINCDNLNFCEVRDTASVLNGCESILPAKWKNFKAGFEKIKDETVKSVESCIKQQGEPLLPNEPVNPLVYFRKKAFRNCLVPKLTDVRLSYQSAVASLNNQWNSFKDWSNASINHVQMAVLEECRRIKNKQSADFQKCRLKASLNALLEDMSVPYEKLGYKAATDHITKALITDIIEHKQQKDCFDAKGTGLEFCLLIAGVATGAVQSTAEIVSSIPGPIGRESKIVAETFESKAIINDKHRLASGTNSATFNKYEKEIERLDPEIINTFEQLKSTYTAKRQLEAYLEKTKSVTFKLDKKLLDHYELHNQDDISEKYLLANVLKEKLNKIEALKLEDSELSYDTAKNGIKKFIKSDNQADFNAMFAKCWIMMEEKLSDKNCPDEKILKTFFIKGRPNDQNALMKNYASQLAGTLSLSLRNTMTTIAPSSESIKALEKFLHPNKDVKVLIDKSRSRDDVDIMQWEFKDASGKLTRYEAAICKTSSCSPPKDVSSSDFKAVPKNTILSFYPVCGAHVLNLPSLKDVLQKGAVGLRECD